MPNIPQQQTIVQYVANNAQTQYTFSFYAIAPANIAVYYQAANAVPIPASDILRLNVDYTVTFNADPTTGGYITLLFTPTSGFYLTIALALQTTLNTNFGLAQNFNGSALDAALDYLLMLIQQVTYYSLNRNLSYVINTYLPNAVPFTQLPTLSQNQVWMGSGAGVVAATISTIPSASVLQSMLANNSPGTDGARLVGYYDAIHSTPTTVQAYLASLLNSPTINTPIINTPTINTPNIVGVINGSNAAAGSVGELISNVVTGLSPVSFTNNTVQNLTSILLTPGDWDVWGNMTFNVSGGGANSVAGWINTVSAVQPDASLVFANVIGSFNISIYGSPVPSQRISVSTNTTIYLSGIIVINGGTIAVTGGIYARRRR